MLLRGNRVSPHHLLLRVWINLIFVVSVLAGDTFTPQHFTVRDGLSNNDIFAILQDRYGYLWIGTENGLNRYDGYAFKQFHHDPTDPNSLSDDDVSCLLEDADGIWVGTWGGGLNHFNPETEKFTHRKAGDAGTPGLKQNPLPHPPEAEGILWIGTFDGGLNRYEVGADRFTAFRHVYGDDDTVPHDRIWAITRQANELLWLGTSGGLARFYPDSGTAARFRSHRDDPIDLDGVEIRALETDRIGRLWIGTGQGLFRLNPVTGRLKSYTLNPKTGKAELINTIYRDRKNRIWAGSVLGGLGQYHEEDNRFVAFRHEDIRGQNLGHNDVRRLFLDRSDILWIGTRGAGLARFDQKPSKFKTWRYDPHNKDTLSPHVVRAIQADSEHIWAGLEGGGIDRINRKSGKIQRFRHDPDDPTSLSHDLVFALVRDHEGFLWAGTHRGLNRFDRNDQQVTRFLHNGEADGLPNNLIVCLLADEAGLWIGTHGGLARYEKERFTSWKHDPKKPESLSQDRVYSLYRQNDGVLWVGTYARGLNRFEPGQNRFRHYKHNPNELQSLSNDSVFAIDEAMGFLWLGTHGGGLNRLNRETGTFLRYNRKHGLPGNVVYAILHDQHNHLWLSTGNGLSRFDPLAEKFRNFDILDGLQSNQFSTGSGFRSTAGELFFGGVEGLTSFIPSNIVDNHYQPSTLFTDIQVPSQPDQYDLTGQGNITLDHKADLITITFSAADYTCPPKNTYAYKMEGYEEQWIEAGTRNNAIYTNLPPGDYRFRVKAANNDGVWNEEGRALALTIKPPPYNNVWSRSLYLILLIVCFISTLKFFRWRERERHKVKLLEESQRMTAEANRAKRIFLDNMSHDLRTPITAIIGYSELIEEELEDLPDPDAFDPDLIRPDLDKIKSSAYYQLGLITKLLELSKIEAGQVQVTIDTFEVDTLIDEVLVNFEPQLDRHQNQFELKANRPLGIMKADQAKLRETLLNLLSNANRYTDKGLITLDVAKSSRNGENWFSFVVEDDGIGMSREQVETLFDLYPANRKESDGIGLVLIRHYCRLMDGDISVDSEPGRGTRITVTIRATPA